MPGHVKRRAAKLRGRIAMEEQEIKQLVAIKAQLLKELEDLERVHHRFDPHLLSSMIGYKLSNFQLTVRGDEKIYAASCYDLRFGMTVICKECTVLKINLDYFEDSSLHEINTHLLRFSRELCPARVLFTIQQFDQLFKFRQKIYEQLDGRYFRRTFTQNFDKELGQPDSVCNIEVYQKNILGNAHSCILKMQWRFSWNIPCQSLVHQFDIIQAVTQVEEINTFIESLHCTVFFDDDSLMQIWCSFNQWVSVGSQSGMSTCR